MPWMRADAAAGGTDVVCASRFVSRLRSSMPCVLPAAAPITPAVPAVGVATPARLADERRRNSAPAVVPANVGGRRAGSRA